MPERGESDSPRVAAGRDRQLSSLARLAIVLGVPFGSVFLRMPLWFTLLLLLGLAGFLFVGPHLPRKSRPDPKQDWTRLMAGFVKLQSAYCALQKSPANADAREQFSVFEEKCLSLLSSRADSDWGTDSEYAPKIRDEIAVMSAEVRAKDADPGSTPGPGTEPPAETGKPVLRPERKVAAVQRGNPAPSPRPDVPTSEELLALISADERAAACLSGPMSTARPDATTPADEQDLTLASGEAAPRRNSPAAHAKPAVAGLAGKRLTPCIWLPGGVEAAAEFYLSVFKNSQVTWMSRYPERTGEVMSATVCLDGLELMLLDAGPATELPEASSLLLRCADQAEVDYYWQRLLSGGGEEGMCGWLTDRFGVSWKVIPDALLELLNDPDPQRAARAAEAMLKMKKIDIAALHEAVAILPHTTTSALLT